MKMYKNPSWQESTIFPLDLASTISGVLTKTTNLIHPKEEEEGYNDFSFHDNHRHFNIILHLPSSLQQPQYYGWTTATTSTTTTPLSLRKNEPQIRHRHPIIAGNWKCNPSTIQEATTLLTELAQKYYSLVQQNNNSDDEAQQKEVVIFPPMAYLGLAISLLKDTGIKVGCQNISCIQNNNHESSSSSSKSSGAFTGEVTASMIGSMGCQYVMIGHSERRTLFQEDDDMIHNKIVSVLEQTSSNNLKIILCIGETEKEVDFSSTVLQYQIQKALAGIPRDDVMNRIVIAYEPVWAIGTGMSATPTQVQTAHSTIRQTLAKMYDEDIAQTVRIQYGGSVQPNTIQSLMNMSDVDGALVGGASLTSDSFTRIIHQSTPSAITTI